MAEAMQYIEDEDFPGYSLCVDVSEEDPDLPFFRITRRELLGPHYFFEKFNFLSPQVNITGHSLDAYHDMHPQMKEITPDMRIAEIGAGLGAFIPEVVDTVEERPTVIDVVDYSMLKRFIEKVFEEEDTLDLPQHAKDALKVMLARIDIYTDASRVRLFNGPAGKVIWGNPELHGQMDLVVDRFGAARFSLMTKSLLEVERFLLNPDKPEGSWHVYAGETIH